MSDRRRFLQVMALAAASLAGCASPSQKGQAHVVVVGGGFGGATVAKYLRLWSQGTVRVTLVERNPQFISCPMSNRVVAGLDPMTALTQSYDALRARWGVDVVTDEVVGIDLARRTVTLVSRNILLYDRLILSPGIELQSELVPGLAGQEAHIPPRLEGGPQTLLLRQQLEAMGDGGVFALHIPRAPYRCPPAYERACLVAHYLKTTKPRSKVLVLDANEEIQSKKGLFTQVFDTRYRGILEYHPNSELREVDGTNRIAVLDFDRIQADVLNVIPPQKAGKVLDLTGIPLVNGRWAAVDWRTLEAKDLAGVHVLGDAVLAAPAMPKSGHMANQHAKLAAAAILSAFADQPPEPTPLIANTCYSFVDANQAIHVASVHRYNPKTHTLEPVQGAGGVSAVPSAQEGDFARAWARNIWGDMLG